MPGKRWFHIALWCSLALGLVLLVLALLSPGAKITTYTQSQPLHMVGEYSINRSPERFAITPDTQFDLLNATQITLYGHFDQIVVPNTQVIMHISDLHVTLLVNAQVVFSFGDEHPVWMHSAGTVWSAFTTNGIQLQDAVELRLTASYAGIRFPNYDDFLSSLSVGSEYPVYRAILATEGYHLVIGLVILFLGIILAGISLYACALHFTNAIAYLYLSGFVIVIGIWTGINYRYISLLLPYPAFTTVLDGLCLALAPVFLLRYVLILVNERCRKRCVQMLFIALACVLIGLCLQIAGMVDLKVISGFNAVLYLAGGSILLPCLLQELRNPCTADTRSAIIPLLILFVGMLLNVANYFFRWGTSGLLFALAFLIFALLELFRLIRALRETVRRNSEYARLENELTQSRIAVMLSQIKPHFLFNALNSISALCLTDPIMADQAITSLSNYLRGNIRSLEQSQPVPFERELDHIKYYVRLEQLRYGDKLRVVYAIDTIDFQVPTLSLQTLVENAIRHGVSPRPEGGLVVVHTERGDGFTLIRIMDNGVGFDPDLHSRNADSIGLANAKQRMEVMMGAQFDIQSIPGKGTTISIRIPNR